ncbi:MAG: DUF1207 domain-containing protein [Nitrospiraceae bacterium]
MTVALKLIGTLVLLVALETAVVAATPAEDSYLAGYATAVLRQEFGLSEGTVEVRDGVITVTADGLRGARRDRITAALMGIRNVKRVEIRAPSEQPSASPDPRAVRTEIPPPASHFLPRGQLFAPLHADPRWPHFSAAYRRYIDTPEFTNVFAPTFGETFGLYRNKAPLGGQWELGVQGGVFAIFDIDARSKDLINADYLIALLSSYRAGDFSAFVRVAHLSSHLGDEYLLRSSVNQVNRINLSLESVDVKLSYDMWNILRLYGGGGYLVRREPQTIKPGTAQFGVEFQSPRTFFSRTVRPVAYADFQSFEETKWSTDVSIRAGVQLENFHIGDRYIQFLAEYFNGHSPNGQFFVGKIESIGLGIHLYF